MAWKVQRSGAQFVWNLEAYTKALRRNNPWGAVDVVMIQELNIERCDETYYVHETR